MDDEDQKRKALEGLSEGRGTTAYNKLQDLVGKVPDFATAPKSDSILDNYDNAVPGPPIGKAAKSAKSLFNDLKATDIQKMITTPDIKDAKFHAQDIIDALRKKYPEHADELMKHVQDYISNRNKTP